MYPTDLSPEEQTLAETRLRELADEFTEDGTLRTPQWREVFQRTWRHHYVPSYYPELGEPCLRSVDPKRRGEWLAAVYSNQTLVTKVVQVPLSSASRPGSYPMWTSSSSLPSLVLTMLEALEVTDGCRVLEIGTGSGYNAALLCERLGSGLVTSVDIDPELVELARERLASNGHTPVLAAVDGAGGYPPGARYDRILATCSVPAIPQAWLEQTAPDGMVMADVRGAIGGTVVRLTASGNGAATGRFLPGYASFMPMRHTAEGTPSVPARRSLADHPVDSVSDVDPKLLHEELTFMFVLQWHLPGVTWGFAYAEDGDIGTQLDAADGSSAQAWHTPGSDGFLVRQAGPRLLWDQVEQAYAFWQQAGKPNHERFGITASAHEQYVWYDHPDSEHRWPLPMTAP